MWFPPAGIGLLLTAWLGRRGAVLVGADAVFVLLTAWALGRGPVSSWTPLLSDALLAGPEAWLAWWCYHHLARGARRISDPRSAILFLILVPGVLTGAFALLRALLPGPADVVVVGQWAWAFWASRALGILALVPAPLVLATPWLIRVGLAAAERPGEFRGADLAGRLTTGDLIEVGGLTAATTMLNIVLLLVGQGRAAVSWQLWVLPLLLLVWTSLRQGLGGGTAVATASTALSLVLVSLFSQSDPFVNPLQGYLLAQCCTALLVGSSFSWIHGSEARYRQVVEHLPVILYSARFLGPAGTRGRLPPIEVTFASPASLAVFGCSHQELLGSYDKWLQRVHADDRELLQAAIVQLRQRQPVTCEYRLLSDTVPTPGNGAVEHLPPPPSARERWLRDTLVPLVGVDGELEGWEGIAADITEQRALAIDLRRTTSMFNTLVNHLPAGVFFVQASNGRPILVNARARKLLGQREDLSATLAQWPEVYRLFRPDGTPYPSDELPVSIALRRGITSMRDDIVVHRPDGRRIPLVGWAAPIDLGGHGRSDAAVWVLEDLTTLHQAEAARRESEGRLRTVIEAMAEGVEVCAQDGTIIDCNPAACAILDVPAEQLRGQKLAELGWTYVREEGTPCPVEEHPIQVSLRTGQPVRGRVLGLPRRGPGTESGEPRSMMKWLLFNTIPLLEGRSPTPARVVATFTDITAQRQALEAIRGSEEKYRELVESLPLMVMQLDRELRVTYLNPAARTIAGYELEDVQRPEFWQRFIHAEDRPGLEAAIRSATTDATPPIEFRWRAREGTERIGCVIYQPRWQNGEHAGTTALIMDTTVQRRLEEELQRSQRLELVGRLASGIVHDFNNLLTVMLSLCEMAQESLADGHPARADLRRIYEAGEQAARLAEQLLTFSKQRRIDLQRIDVNEAVRHTLELLGRTLPKNIELRCELSSAALAVMADPTQLQQVVMNLSLNARDAMQPAGGGLTIRTAAASDGSGAAVKLTIEDTGQGMSEEVRARIFDPFFSTKEWGTGLGLAVVQQIVAGFNGRVEVWSEPGRGSRFDVWLPRVPEGPAD